MKTRLFILAILISGILDFAQAQKMSGKEFSAEVKNEMQRSWNAYKKYAWGHDVLKPLSRSYSDWYEKPLYISPIDAYSTLHLMGFQEEAAEIESYVIDSLDFNQDIFAKTFEVNIRILGGLLAMYDISGKQQLLEKAQDFADRMLPAFNTKTGIPRYWVNLRTEATKGDTVNVAEAGTYLLEMGILSYFTGEPKYYHAAKKATKAVYERRSDIGLIGDVIDVQSGEWVSETSHICAGVDSYYEYLLKAFLLFGDQDLKHMWDESLEKINHYLADQHGGRLWYGRVNMHSGDQVSSVVTLYDAFFPAVLALSGEMQNAKNLQTSWDWLWSKYGLEPTAYDYKKGEITYPVYSLNPEIMESAYYLYTLTKDFKFYSMNEKYWIDLKTHCRTEVAYSSIEDVRTMEKRDYMPTYFFAETLKYLYLTFSGKEVKFIMEDHIFTTEAHQFKKSSFDRKETGKRLGFQN